jgi:hypothetical protein
MTDEEIEALESIANTLRGMTLDQRIPEDARDVLAASAGVIDAITEDDDMDEEPCGECRLQPGEICDICGRSNPSS